MNLQSYIEDLEKEGRLSFTLEEASYALSQPKKYISNKIKNLKGKGVLVSPLKGFYVIIPLKRRSLGSLPARDLVVITMKKIRHSLLCRIADSRCLSWSHTPKIKSFPSSDKQKDAKKMDFWQSLDRIYL